MKKDIKWAEDLEEFYINRKIEIVHETFLISNQPIIVALLKESLKN